MINKKRVIFILPVNSQPRYVKRINVFKENNFDTHIYSFERNYFTGGNNDFISLGQVEHGNYFKRITILLKALMKLIKDKTEIEKGNLFFVFGLDNLILVSILKKLLRLDIPIIYEVSDIRRIMFQSNIMAKLIRNLEKKFIQKASLITVTSPYYITEFYEPVMKISKENFLVIENKLMRPVPLPINTKVKKNKNIVTIGYFGLLRCQKSWDLLYELAKRNPNTIEIYIKGYLMNLDNFHERIEELKNIKYTGEYNSPDDLAEIYKNIDISLIGNVSTNIENGKLALPNRYYESLFYNKPMIAHKKTAVGNRIKELNVGWTVDFNNVEDSINKIINISSIEYKNIQKNTYVNEELVLSDNDQQKLLDIVSNLLK